MAVDITLDGKPVWNTESYSVVEDSTPLDPSDSTGGTGQITIGKPLADGDRQTLGKTLVLKDGAQGITAGIVSGMSADESNLTITADSRLNALNVERVAAPFSGTLGDLFSYYLGLVGITETIVIDATLAAREVTVKGWYANVWTQMKKLCAAQQVEITLASNLIVVREPRGRKTVDYRDSATSWEIDTSGAARSFDIYVYTNLSQGSGTLYPLSPATSQTTFTVESGQTVTETIDLNPPGDGMGATIISVNQPSAHNAFSEYGDNGGYTITGGDGKGYWAGTWLKRGGKLEVKIGPERDSLIVTITGALDGARGPFSIALAGNDNTSTPSLRITGDGSFYAKEKRTFQTGVSDDLASEDTGVTIDNEFITEDTLYSTAQHTMARYIGPKITYHATSRGINRVGDVGGYTFATFDTFDESVADGYTMGDFDDDHADEETFGDFDANEFTDLDKEFENQAFGNVAGARTDRDGNFYRIRSATIREGSIAYNSEMDTVFGDLDDLTPDGFTMGDFDALLDDDATFQSYDLGPLTVS